MATFNIEISTKIRCNFVVKADSKKEAERLARDRVDFIDPDFYKEDGWVVSSSIEMTDEVAIKKAKGETCRQGTYIEEKS